MLYLLVLLLAVPGFSQSPARKKATAAPKAAETKRPTFPLAQIVVKGNKRYTAQQVVHASGLKIGALVTDGMFDEAKERLMKTGAFESVSYQFGPDAEGKGYVGTLAVEEVEQQFPFRFEELPAPDADLRTFLK